MSNSVYDELKGLGIDLAKPMGELPTTPLHDAAEFAITPVERPGAAVAESIGGDIVGPAIGTAVNTLLNIPQAALGLTGLKAGEQLGDHLIKTGFAARNPNISAALSVAPLFGEALLNAPVRAAYIPSLLGKDAAQMSKREWVKHVRKVRSEGGVPILSREVGKTTPIEYMPGWQMMKSGFKQVGLDPTKLIRSAEASNVAEKLTSPVEHTVPAPREFQGPLPNQQGPLPLEAIQGPHPAFVTAGPLPAGKVQTSVVSAGSKRLATRASDIIGRAVDAIEIPTGTLTASFGKKALEFVNDPSTIFTGLASKDPSTASAAVWAAKVHRMEIPVGISAEAEEAAIGIRNISEIQAERLAARTKPAAKAVDDIMISGEHGTTRKPLLEHTKDVESVEQVKQKLGRRMHNKVYSKPERAEFFAGTKLAEAGINYEIVQTKAGYAVKILDETIENLPIAIANAKKVEVANATIAAVKKQLSKGKKKVDTTKIMGKKPELPALGKAKVTVFTSEKAKRVPTSPKELYASANAGLKNKLGVMAANVDDLLDEMVYYEKLLKDRDLTTVEKASFVEFQTQYAKAAQALAKETNADPIVAAEEIMRQAERGYIDPHLLLHFASSFAGAGIGATSSASEGGNPLIGALVGAVLGAAAPALFKALMRAQVEKGSAVTVKEGSGTVVAGDGRFWKVRLTEKGEDGKDAFITRIASEVHLEGVSHKPFSNRSSYINDPDMEANAALAARIETTLPSKIQGSAKMRATFHRLHKWSKNALRGRDYKLNGIPVVKEHLVTVRDEMRKGIGIAGDHNKQLNGILGSTLLRDGTFSRYVIMKDMIAHVKRGGTVLDAEGRPLKLEELELGFNNQIKNFTAETAEKIEAAYTTQRAIYKEMFQQRLNAGISTADELEDYFPRIMDKLATKDVKVTPTGRDLTERSAKGGVGRGQATFEHERGEVYIPHFENDILKTNNTYIARHFADVAKIKFFNSVLEHPDYAVQVRRNADGTWPKAPMVVGGKEAMLWEGKSLLNALHVDSLIDPARVIEGQLFEKFGIAEASNYRMYVRKDLAKGLEDHFNYSVPTPVGKAARTVTRLWKEMVLHPAVVGIGYDMLNLLGDAERLALFAPGAFDKVQDAAKLAHYIKNQKLDIKEFVESTSGPLLREGELPKLGGPLTEAKMKELAMFMRRNGIAGGGFHEIELGAFQGSANLSYANSYMRGADRGKAYVDVTRDFISKYRGMREDTLRIAAALKMLEYAETAPQKLQKVIDRLAPVGSKDKLGNARSDYYKYIDGLRGADRPDLLVGKLSRDILIDYGDFSKFEQSFLRGLFIPFWAFMKGNAVGLSRMAVNDPKQFALVSGSIYGMSHLWNSTMFPEQEKQMKAWQQARPHIWLPRPIQTEGSSPYVAVGYNSIFQDFFENVMMFNGINSFEQGVDGDPVAAFTAHSEQALGKLLNKSGFAINPGLAIPNVLSPVLNKIQHGEVPTKDEWDRVSDSFMIKLLPGGRAISQMFDEDKTINQFDFGYKQSGLGRFSHDVNKAQ